MANKAVVFLSMIINVITTFLEHHSKAKRRAPAY